MEKDKIIKRGQFRRRKKRKRKGEQLLGHESGKRRDYQYKQEIEKKEINGTEATHLYLKSLPSRRPQK